GYGAACCGRRSCGRCRLAAALGGAGSVSVAGSLAVTEVGADTAAATGAVLVACALSATETGQDTLIATPAGSISGVMAAIEAADRFAAKGHGKAPLVARRAGDRGYATQTMGRRPVQTMRRPRQTG